MGITARVVGYLASLLLTLAAFAIVANPAWFHLGVGTAIGTILVLALIQFGFQSICFLNVLHTKGDRWNLVVFTSTLAIIFIIIVGSIWIMHHLDANMMPEMHH